MAHGRTNWTVYTTSISAELAVIPSLILLLILINNILVLVTFKRMPDLKLQHYIIMGLACADLVPLPSFSVTTVTMAAGHITLTDTLCRLLAVLNHSCIGSTAWIHCLMCLDRLIAAIRPLKHKMFTTSHKAKTASIISLVICFVVPLLLTTFLINLNGIRPRFIEDAAACSFPVDFRLLPILAGSFVIIPILVQITTHGVVFYKLRRLNTQRTYRRRILKPLATVALTLGLYYACWSPFVVGIIWAHFAEPKNPPKYLTALSVQAIFANSAMSFTVYMLTLPKFRATWNNKISRRRNRMLVLPTKNTGPHRSAFNHSQRSERVSYRTTNGSSNNCTVTVEHPLNVHQ